MELPWPCPVCGFETMIDIENLEKKDINKIFTSMGFKCAACGAWVTVSFETTSLREQMRKLMYLEPGHPKFNFLFGKVLKKATAVNERGEQLWRAQM